MYVKFSLGHIPDIQKSECIRLPSMGPIQRIRLSHVSGYSACRYISIFPIVYFFGCDALVICLLSFFNAKGQGKCVRNGGALYRGSVPYILQQLWPGGLKKYRSL